MARVSTGAGLGGAEPAAEVEAEVAAEEEEGPERMTVLKSGSVGMMERQSAETIGHSCESQIYQTWRCNKRTATIIALSSE